MHEDLAVPNFSCVRRGGHDAHHLVHLAPADEGSDLVEIQAKCNPKWLSAVATTRITLSTWHLQVCIGEVNLGPNLGQMRLDWL